MDSRDLTGPELLAVLAALANPHRLRILGALAEGRRYVSPLARQLGMSRPLLHMHLQRLQAAGLVRGELELSEAGRAVKYFEAVPFTIRLDPRALKEIAPSLPESDRGSAQREGTD